VPYQRSTESVLPANFLPITDILQKNSTVHSHKEYTITSNSKFINNDENHLKKFSSVTKGAQDWNKWK